MRGVAMMPATTNSPASPVSLREATRHPPVGRLIDGLFMRAVQAIGTTAARAAIWIVALAAVPFMLAFTFLIAARWLIWFAAGLLLMVYALGSAEYARWFWLAFLIPMFVGGLVDGAFALAAQGRRRRDANAV